jgi:hypothetical protein
MKNLFQKSLMALALAAGIGFSSCKKEEEEEVVSADAGFEILSGNLPTQKLDSTKKYLLKGYVFVQAGQILTIPPGTFIFGDKATKGTLVINRGGKIMAEGTAEKPIVFTSRLAPGERERGDWGGVVILGNASTNRPDIPIEGITPAVTFGTSSTEFDNESSGKLKYIRIEFAGIALSPDNEINGLTFGGVGSGTLVENIQVSYSGDDAFEWFGGTVNCKNLIALGTWDDDFDTDYGYRGKIQFALSVREPFSADKSGSNAFESDNDPSGTDNTPKTAPVFSNITILGPRYDPSVSIEASYKNVVHSRRNSAVSIYNSLLTGFPVGIRIDGLKSMENYQVGTGEIASNLLISLASQTAATPFVGGATKSDRTDNVDTASVKNYYLPKNLVPITTTELLNYSELGVDINLYSGKNTAYQANPNFAVTSGRISSGADFSHTKLGQFFEVVLNLGAFGITDWTDGWSNFNPKGQAYP